MTNHPVIRVGNFFFDSISGELHASRENADTTTAPTRLAPQPAQLLTMLLDACPDVVSREEIQQHLWPGVSADYERNLHFCIRQIRAALGESASAPQYLETIPRRGYRIIADVQRGVHWGPGDVQIEAASFEAASFEAASLNAAPDETGGEQSGSTDTSLQDYQHSPSFSLQRSYRFAIAIGVFGMLLFLAAWGTAAWFGSEGDTGGQKLDGQTGTAQNSVVSVAIMPFVHSDPKFTDLGNGTVAHELLSQLEPHFEALSVLGPTSTEPLVDQGHSTRDIANRLEVDFIVNGRYLTDNPSPSLLVEIIRVADGRHVWVRDYDLESTRLQIVREVLPELLQITKITASGS